MTLAESLKLTVFNARGVAGALGFRTHTIWRVVKYGESARSDVAEKVTPIVEGNGQPPRIHWLTGEELTVGQLNPGTAIVGPMTPKFSGGGTDIALLHGEDLGPNDKLYFRVLGPRHADGALYRKFRISEEKALRYIMYIVPVEDEGTP